MSEGVSVEEWHKAKKTTKNQVTVDPMPQVLQVYVYPVPSHKHTNAIISCLFQVLVALYVSVVTF